MKKLKLPFILLLSAFTFKVAAQHTVIPRFIIENPGKSAIYLVQNGKVLADINSDKKFPLASTVKIIVAIEYATQAGAGKINPETRVDTAELAKYYVPYTDGGAHPEWLKDMETAGLLTDGKISLEEIAKGMINYSSNANTEYLLDLLGLERINAQLQKLGLTHHDRLYYLVSALGVINGRDAKELEAMPMEEYIVATEKEHAKLKADPAYRFKLNDLPLPVQKVWSDRLPASTAKEYVSIMQKINSHTYFDEQVQKHIDVVMEGLLQNPANRQWLKHAGTKGGSTAWVLTKTMYATTTGGETTEMAYFFNDLTSKEFTKLSKNLNQFELSILAYKDKREEVLNVLNSK